MKKTLYSWFLLFLLIPHACETTDPASLSPRPLLDSPSAGGLTTTLQIIPPASLSSDSHPLQIDAMRSRDYPGSDIVIESVLEPGVNYGRYYVSYLSDGLKI
ncbi:MAG TPA: hypothetical protein VK880_04270, partial [Anaerolineales bacterium]|nr:hypothetical protein [Anaerolineales bacterium]